MTLSALNTLLDRLHSCRAFQSDPVPKTQIEQMIASIPQAAVASYSPFLRRYFQIPDNQLTLCAISFGYPDTEHPANGFRTERAPLDEIVDWRG